MIMWLKVFVESFRQAYQSLVSNKLRSFLSLLGIVIGIFCIISVQSAVDSLQDNIVNGFSELGSNVIYIEKMPWNEDPGQNYWKYAKRPEPSYKDYESVTDRSKLMEAASYVVFTGGRTIKYRSKSVSNAFIMGATHEYQQIQNVEIEKGRYFTPNEYLTGSNKIILGAKVASQLFESIDPIGKDVRLFGQNFHVIGVLKEEGANMFNFINFDDVMWLNYHSARKFINVNDNNRFVGRMFNVKAKSDVDVEDLKSEVAGILRSSRKLKPTEKDDFALNEIGLLGEVLDSVFSVLNTAGIIIGMFAMLVGMFSVANIMFVSVKERTSLIGIKKALGAKKFVILTEFLIEAVFLCVLGGIIGLVVVFGLMKVMSAITPMVFGLSSGNVILGVGVSILVGIVAGILPALQAAKMNPVEAIRS